MVLTQHICIIAANVGSTYYAIDYLGRDSVWCAKDSNMPGIRTNTRFNLSSNTKTMVLFCVRFPVS